MQLLDLPNEAIERILWHALPDSVEVDASDKSGLILERKRQAARISFEAVCRRFQSCARSISVGVCVVTGANAARLGQRAMMGHLSLGRVRRAYLSWTGDEYIYDEDVQAVLGLAANMLGCTELTFAVPAETIDSRGVNNSISEMLDQIESWPTFAILKGLALVNSEDLWNERSDFTPDATIIRRLCHCARLQSLIIGFVCNAETSSSYFERKARAPPLPDLRYLACMLSPPYLTPAVAVELLMSWPTLYENALHLDVSTSPVAKQYEGPRLELHPCKVLEWGTLGLDRYLPVQQKCSGPVIWVAHRTMVHLWTGSYLTALLGTMQRLTTLHLGELVLGPEFRRRHPDGDVADMAECLRALIWQLPKAILELSMLDTSWGVLTVYEQAKLETYLQQRKIAFRPLSRAEVEEKVLQR